MLNDDRCTKTAPFVCDGFVIPDSKNTTGCDGVDIYVHCDDVLYVYYGHNVTEDDPYEYVGCFKDTSTRALSGGPGGTRMTIEECYAACTEYTYFAVQDGHSSTEGECRCGNSLSEATQYGTSTGCNTAMGTGGTWANSLYEVTRANQWTQIGYNSHWNTMWSHSLDYVDELTSLRFKCTDNGYMLTLHIFLNVSTK